MKLLWLTDIHLDYLCADGYDPCIAKIKNADKIRNFCVDILKREFDAIAISGDISMAGSEDEDFYLDTEYCLKRMAEVIQKPIYFVNGNHDFWYGSISKVKGGFLTRHLNKAKQSDDYDKYVTWLEAAGVVELTSNTAIIGHDGWYDMLEDIPKLHFGMPEFSLTKEFKGAPWWNISSTATGLARQSEVQLRIYLTQALQKYDKVILVTHVPPFKEVCFHRGQPCDPNVLPFYTNQLLGRTLKDIMEEYPKKELIVLAGHTHGKAEANILPNIKAKVGKGSHGTPVIQEVISLP